jgi:hypothetical protein
MRISASSCVLKRETQSIAKFLTSFSTTSVVDVVDRYYIETSIKSVERGRRSLSSERHRVYQVNEGSAIPDWRQFLANTKK